MDSASVELALPAPAKVNLYLGVHAELDERRYHRVDSVMIAVDLADVVRVRPASQLQVICQPAVSFPQEKNTAYKAAVRLSQLANRVPDFCITIEKHVPEQSGMGGSSSDAATVVRALCQLWGLDPASEDVRRVAASVGADVPFFLNPLPTLLVGAGDVPQETFPAMDGLPLVLVRPAGPGVSTVAAYAEFDRAHEEPADPEPLLAALRAGDRAAVAANLHNNLDPVACKLLPADGEVKSWLLAQPGAVSGQVSGSGSTVFAICQSDAAAAQIAASAKARGWWPQVAHTTSPSAVGAA